MTDQLKIPQAEVEKALKVFVDKEYLIVSDERISVTDKDFQIVQDHDGFCEFGAKLAGFFFDFYKDRNIVRVPDSVASTLVLGFAKEDLPEIRDMQKQYILSMLKHSKRAQKPTDLVFLSNLYLELPLKKKQCR